MNMKLSVVSLIGLMLSFPAIAFAQPQVSNTFTAGPTDRVTMSVDEAIGLQWIEGHKSFVIEVVARAAKRISTNNYFNVKYKNFEITPVLDKELFGISVSYKW